jgi:hypothetical protein
VQILSQIVSREQIKPKIYNSTRTFYLEKQEVATTIMDRRFHEKGTFGRSDGDEMMIIKLLR